METLQIDPAQEMKFNKFRLREECQERLNRLKQDVVERPFLSLAIAFTCGLLAQTFPVRLLLLLVVKIASRLVGPTILALGAVKAFEIISSQIDLDFLEQREKMKSERV
jgi:hypothetical protein